MYLNNNEFEAVPAVVLDLPRLRRLMLNNNRLADLPVDIRYLQHLRVLALSSNYIVALPQEIGELKHLEEVHPRARLCVCVCVCVFVCFIIVRLCGLRVAKEENCFPVRECVYASYL